MTSFRKPRSAPATPTARSRLLPLLALMAPLTPALAAVTVDGKIAPGEYEGGEHVTDFRLTDPLTGAPSVGSSRVDLQACKLEYSIVSPK